jgi:hypothetical protein
MDTGVFALAGIFGLAAVFAVWNVAFRQSIARQLESRGFEKCDDEAPALERAWRTATGAGAPEELKIVGCRRRPAGRGWLYHFTVRERSGRGSHDSDSPGASYPAYLFDLRDPSWVGRSAVSLHVLPPGSKFMRRLLAGAVGLSDARPRLELGDHPWRETIVAAHGDVVGRLDDAMPEAMQDRLARAAAHGFFTIHVGGGKVALAANPAHRDVDAQTTYLNSWV